MTIIIPRLLLRQPYTSFILVRSIHSTQRALSDQPPSIYQIPKSATQPKLSFTQKFGIPLTSFFLWSSLTLVSLQWLWTRLSFEEARIENETKYEELKDQVGVYRDKVEAIQRQQRLHELVEMENKTGTQVAKKTKWSLW
jgi:hypothetical protein